MKQQVITFVRNLGGSTRYSGKDRTMYVMGITTEQAMTIPSTFGRLPFSIIRQA